jgi:hypothetical protein
MLLAVNPSAHISWEETIGLNKQLMISTGRLMARAIPIIAHSGVTLSSYVIGTYC